MEFVRKNLDISFKEGPDLFPELLQKAILVKFNVATFIYREYGKVHLLFPRDDKSNSIDQLEIILSNNEILKKFIDENLDVTAVEYKDIIKTNEYNRAVGKLNSLFPNGGWAITSKAMADSSGKFIIYFSQKSDAIRFKLMF